MSENISQQLGIPEAFKKGVELLGGAKTPAEAEQSVFVFGKILESGQSSAAIESNLGKAYAKKGDWASSVEHFEKAMRLSRWNGDAREDLKLARSKITSNMGTSLSHPLEMAYQIASYVRPSEWLALSSLCMFALLAMRYRMRSKLSAKFLVVQSLAVLVFVSLGIFTFSSHSLALLKEDKVALHSAPLESSEVSMELPQGARLRILRESAPFIEVERPGQLRGWIKSDSLESLSF